LQLKKQTSLEGSSVTQQLTFVSFDRIHQKDVFEMQCMLSGKWVGWNMFDIWWVCMAQLPNKDIFLQF